jgi:ApbE superfamily uncharacterized protein (UPF0280 family)
MVSGGRLHLHHGPVDRIIGVWGPDRDRALQQAVARFETVLERLAGELDILRAPVGGHLPRGRIARRMVRAVAPHAGVFVTPMAAVAGAVADEICAVMVAGLDLTRAYVNNGGDIAVYLGNDRELRAAMPGCGQVVLSSEGAARGLATSGWRGRSHSLGIADAVTVVAQNAAQADAAATLVANAVDLPGHPAIGRRAANTLLPDSDLGPRPVTVAVGALSGQEVTQALARGGACAEKMLENGLVTAVALFLNDQTYAVGTLETGGQQDLTGEKNAGFQIAQDAGFY